MPNAGFQSLIPNLVPFPVPLPMQGLLAKTLGIAELESIYRQLRAMGDERPITERLLERLKVTWTTSETDLARVPRTGTAVVTVNHPFGMLEGAVLAEVLGRIRPDVRFLANGMLTAVPEMRDLVIAVDPISGRAAARANGSGIRRSLEHLSGGGLLVVFPAGEVSHFHWQDWEVSDPEWNPAVVRMAALASRRGTRVVVVPAYVAGANSLLFQTAGMIHAGLRTALLGRELLNKRGRRVELRIGTPVAAEKLLDIPTARERVDYLRWRTYLLANREPYRPHTSRPLPRRARAVAAQEPIAAAVVPALLAAEIAALPEERLLSRSGELEVYLAPACEMSNVLREIGRLREITFRAAGEGSGKALDVDEFDADYLHLFVWNARLQEVVGAYRVARTDDVRRKRGVRGLYTATLFEYGDEFLDRLGPALELGRSFIRREYQRAFAPLLLLWKGIGKYVAQNPECRVLFGPVSISNGYQAISRELMVSFLEKYAWLSEWGGLVRHRQEFRARVLTGAHRPAFPRTGLDIEDLSSVVADMEPNQAGVPVLLRQYLKLGGRLLGFNVDPAFANALDGLILVDLTRTGPKLLERYLGKQEAATFLAFQKGT